MSGLEVRPATVGDVATIFALALSRPYTAKWSLSAIAEEIFRGDSIFLVLPARGYLFARVVEAECRLLDIAAAADGAGCGRALLAELVRAAKARGCAKVSFEVSAANARALAFYAKAGAEVVGRRPKFYNDGSDAVLMDLTLR